MDNKQTINHTEIPEEVITEIQRENIPSKAIKVFEWYNRRFILPKDYQEGNFETYAMIQHTQPKPFTTYIALTHNNLWQQEKNIYLYEADQEGNEIWHGEIRMIDIPPTKAFTGFTNTKENYSHQWFGTKRIHTMNTISQYFRWLPLHSGKTFCDTHAKQIRETLTAQGKAQKHISTDQYEEFCMNT